MFAGDRPVRVFSVQIFLTSHSLRLVFDKMCAIEKVDRPLAQLPTPYRITFTRKR
ncbi:hypothetical protein QUB12_17170 [Microcoleus sp. B7-D4]